MDQNDVTAAAPTNDTGKQFDDEISDEELARSNTIQKTTSSFVGRTFTFTKKKKAPEPTEDGKRLARVEKLSTVAFLIFLYYAMAA